MPSRTLNDRLQPALKQRLCKDAPRELAAQQILELVRDDLLQLLETENVAASMDLEGFPEISRSVVNYGRATISGQLMGNEEIAGLKKMLHQAIVDFEPRILPDSLKVDVVSNRPGVLTLSLRAEVWAVPIPLELYLQSMVDVETGEVVDCTGSV